MWWLSKTWMDLEPPGVSSTEWCIMSRTRWLSQSMWGIRAGVGVLLYEDTCPWHHIPRKPSQCGECETLPTPPGSFPVQVTANSSCLNCKGTWLNCMAKNQVLLVFGRTWSNKSLLALFLVGFFLHRPRLALGIPGLPASQWEGKSRSLFPIGNRRP